MNNYLKIYYIIFLLLAFTSCAVGPDYHKPEVDTPEDFRFADVKSDSIINLRWWEIFVDPTLDSLIVTALRENKNVLIAASRIEQARANLGYNKADYGPKFGISASAANKNIFGVTHLEDPINAFTAFGVVNWELDFWGKYRRSTESAKANMLASYYGKRAVELQLISDVAINYFKLLDYKNRLRIAENTLKIRDTALQIIQNRFEHGYTHLLDVDQSVIQKSIAEVSIPEFKKNIAFTENNLRVLMGRFPDSLSVPQGILEINTPINIPSGIPSDLLSRRPDILQSRELYRAQNARIGVAQALRFPSVSLTGLLGLTSNEVNNLLSNGLGWDAGVNLLSPLFEWGKNKRRVEIEREKAKQSILQYENTILNAFREVDNALVNIQSLKESLKANERAYKAASNAGHLSRQRYYQGVTSYLEVIESQRQEFEIQLAYSQNYQQLLTAYVQLYKSLGGGWVTDEEISRYINDYYPATEINRDTLTYRGETVGLYLTTEERKAKKKADKAQRKLEKEQRKQEKASKK